MHNDDMISFAPLLSVLSLCVYIWNTKSNIQATLFLPSSALSFYPLSLSLPLFAQLPVCSTALLCQLIYSALSKPLRRRLSLSLPLARAVPSGKGVDARSPPNPLSGGINITLVHPLCKCDFSAMQICNRELAQAHSEQLKSL